MGRVQAVAEAARVHDKIMRMSVQYLSLVSDMGSSHVDFETQQRTPKDSALFYAEAIRSNGANVFAQTPRRDR